MARQIAGLHPYLKRKVKACLRLMLSEPEIGKVLKDDLAGLRSFRVSRFRIIYRVSAAREIHLVAIGPRERIYEETSRLVRKEKGG
ncbi:MAG: type II toxin-antitoxin system RelE/ParE family toxin [Nitrospirae bacterium]|nr:type II toxin-antitoxin system RelE/ParE family toxin [Nitrospirota bacterium]